MRKVNFGKNFIPKFVATLIAALLLPCLFFLFTFSGQKSAYAATEPEQTYNITSADDFVAYSRAYAAGDRNPKDVLNISISSGNEISDARYISLGTQSRPFAGKLIISTGGIDTFRLYNCPLFDYVSAEMIVGGSGVVKIIRERAAETPAAGVLTQGALFANHVVGGASAASWNVSFLPYSGEGNSAADYGGVIGEIAANASVSVNYNNTSNLPVSGSGSTGLICGTLGAGATLSVSTGGSGSAISVSSTGGNAGGLVGTMDSGATLNFATANNSRVNSVNSGAGYAGGIVGSAVDPVITFGAGEYAVNGTVSGKTGAGGLFGYYKSTAAAGTFTLGNYVVNGITVGGSGSAGGVFGLLENTGAAFDFDGNGHNGEVFLVNINGGSARGGMMGSFKTDALTNVLTIGNIKPTVATSSLSGSDCSGGIIGKIVGNSAAYILIDGDANYNSETNPYPVSITVSGSANAGLVGDTGENGSFLDVKGKVKITGTCGAGFVSNMPQGVLRIQGKTDLSAFNDENDGSAYFVKTRGRALVYAKGTGSDGGWTLLRNLNNNCDDVGGWGQVLRTDGTILSESSLFTVDGSAHTITVKNAYTTVSDITQFALTSLNISLNTDEGIGALQFTSGSANSSATLLGGTLTLGADITLAGTGLTGFTRDDGRNAAFTRIFNGGSHTITLAIGEKYGLKADGTALDADGKQGNIYRHKYIGLFAKIDGAAVSNLTVSGSMVINQTDSGMRAGGFAAYATGSNTFVNLTADFTLKYKTGGNYDFRFGGAIGEASGTGFGATFTDCNITPTVADNTASSVGRPDNPNVAYIGGAIGYLSVGTGTSSPTQSVSVSGGTIGLYYTKSVNTKRESCFGGVIAKIGNAQYVKDKRTVSFADSAKIDVSATGIAAGGCFGGIFGVSWLACDVDIDGLSVKATNITATVAAGSSATPFGGLTQTATGRWNVQSITLTSASYTLPNDGSSFGFIANKTYTNESVNDTNYDSALYIDINYANYGIGALTFTTNPNFSVFDEIVASSKGSGANLIKNGNSIVSITTGGNVIDTSGSSFNTYLNKTAYGRTYGETNANARYYYNIAYARANVSTAKYKFLVWSVKTYAHESLSAWFDTGASGNTFTGSLDMTGLSYYPIDLTGSVAFTNAAIKLDNITMQAAVKYAYYYDDGGVQSSDTRSVRTADNQHYLMHAALFNDVSGTITVNTATVSGNVPKLSDNFCGFLVAGTLGGKDEVKAKCNLNAITFDGVYISVGDDKIDDTRYAPLFINKVGKNSTIDWAGASQTSAYSSFAVNGKYAASSIIGNVGDASARAIYLTFTGFKFDARTSATAVDNFDSVYGTEKSVFGRATILNSFVYFAESSGSYNFGMEEDRTSSVSATHDVVYGKEITSSSENPSKQKKYYGSEYYVHPTAFESATEYDFSTGLYLPYVFIAYNLGEYKHELSVNITFSSVIEGCGKYGDPFVIDDDDKLPIISSIISGGDVGNTVQLYLPSDLTDYDYTDTDYTKYLYNFGTSSFTPSNGGTAQANADVRRYLAGAYYVITKDITLPKKYVALGTATSAEYAFRGVIIGRGNPVVENNSINPLIYSSNGSVIKDITVNVKVEYDSSDVIELAAPQGDNTYEYSSGIQAYGAVIGQILGGDNFIDGVQVRFTAATFSITAKSSSYYPRLTPIGGYVGVVVNGGLVFRNMTSENVGLTALTCDKVSDNSGYLYVNPIIGRVIAGYAFHETNAYAVNSATLDNGNKNYVISDLSPSAGKLNVAYTNSSTFTITVPDGQAVFVLGAIVNSGAASATYDTDNATTEQPYDTDTLTDFWQAYRAHTTARADATYGFVGAAAEEGYAADFAKAGDDVYTDNATKVPYIIRVYSNETDGVYLARCISTKTDNVITVSGACDVAAGFRGIGSLYLSSGLVQLGIKQMSGRIGATNNSYEITLNMRYLEYNHNNVSSYIASAPNNSNNSTAGFGLFNVLAMSSVNATNSVQYLKLSGNVFYDVYRIADGVRANYNFTTFTNNDRTEAGTPRTNDENITLRRTILSIGGLAGFANKQFYIKNVIFGDLYVEGAKSAGGLIGFVHIGDSYSASTTSKIVYESGIANTGFVNVVGGLQAGGLIGRIYRSGVEITGATGGTDIIVRNVESKNANPDETGMTYYANLNTGVGGIVGTCWAIDKKNNGTGGADSGESYKGYTTRRLFITNINVVKGDVAANVRVLNDSGTKNNYAGGFLGSAHNAYIKLENCKLNGVNVSANVAGGFIGRVSQKYLLEIFGCSADGNEKSASVSGTRYAGGAVGWAIGRDYMYFQLLNFTAKDYVIQSTATGTVPAGAGGAVGYAQGDNKAIYDGASYICQFNNLTVLNCDITTDYTNKTDDYLKFKCGTGGLIGVIDTATDGTDSRNTSNKYKFSGYNILVQDTTLTHKNGGSAADSTSATNNRIGDLVGNNAVESPLKLVGVSVRNTGYYVDAITNDFCGKHVGFYNDNDNHYGVDPTSRNNANYYGDGYAVFANFKAASGNAAFGGVDDGTTSADNYTDVAAAYPYVSVNPVITVGGITLTGDGVANSVADLPIQNILSDTTGLYSYAANGYYTGSSGQTNKQAFSPLAGSNLSMFTSEVSGYIGTDFPVLILNDSNRDNSHKMINSYLRLLTNTRHDFGNDGTGEYTVKIYNVVYSGNSGAFTPTAAGASLKRADGQFYMTNDAFDSGKIQFSLIDVRFFDPANASQIAYHLYVPVFVKKVLSYGFDIAAQSGTNYLRSRYTDKFGQALIENVGTPLTLYFRYTYTRTASEWESVINAGEEVNRNYGKTLLFYKANTNEILKELPAGTVLVLVDPNRGGKPYYATVGTALAGNVLNLGAFRESLTNVAGVLTPSGTAFTPVDLDELMTLTATTIGDGSDRMVACDDGYATVMVSGQGYRPATDEEFADGSITKYSITVSGDSFVEQYYLSIFTESNAVNDLLFHYYLITSPTSFDDSNYPSKISDTGGHTMVHLVMGKIFYHDGFDVSSATVLGTEVISGDNNEITVNLTSVLGLSDDLDEQIKANIQSLIGSAEVYQSFLVYLNRKEGAVISKVIIGSPTVVAEYAVDYVLNGTADVSYTPYANADIRQNQNHLEVVSGDLSANFASGNKFEINSVITITYDNAGLLVQFPGRNTTSPDNGVSISGASNIAFSSQGTTYSKNTVGGDENPVVWYYSEAEPTVATLDLNPIGDKLGDFTALGINALNNDDATTAEFDLLAVVDATSLESQITMVYASANITVKLLCKDNDAAYGEFLDVSEYFTVSFEGELPAATVDNGDNYSINIAKATNGHLTDNGSEITLPKLHFTVITGSVFEAAGHTYSNYKVVVEVVLLDGSGAAINASRVFNYVIYTNAKIVPTFIDA